MVLVDFIQRADGRQIRSMLALTVVAGFANAVLVVVVNLAAGQVAQGARPGVWMWLAFVAAFVLYYLCDRVALLRANAIIERLLRDLRISVVAKLRRSELPTVERLGRGQLYNLVAQETNQLSVAFPLLIESFQQAVLLAASLIYLGYLSMAALGVFVVAVSLGILGYQQFNSQLRETMNELGAHQARMVDAVGDIIDGSKQLRLNTRHSDSVFAEFGKLSQSAHLLQCKVGEHWSSMILLTSFVIYFMLGVVAFLFPQYIGGHSTIVFQLVPTLLFCIGPLTRIVAQSPMFLRADVGLSSILAVLRQLDLAPGIDPEQARAEGVRYLDFATIDYKGLCYSYRDSAGVATFVSGPLDLHVARGDALFLVGGNGGGKSTALRLMTGLYPAEAGEIRVDGAPVHMGGFRELFSAIYADFHLFDRLYGLEGVDPAQVTRLIAEMGLQDKVRYEDGRFSDLNLSTGQRKRLALIVALLEDRPVYVFDEWSAEQDVHFREQFYTVILPGLKQRGKTVIVVTHDDRFWHLADRVVKLDLGKVEWERAGRDWEQAQ
jgi:putative pyoverdin transport system ATP-binding/permease protein